MMTPNIQYKKNIKYILDTSAVIALLNKEPGYEIIDTIIANSAMSSVNLAELVTILTRIGVEQEEIDEIITDIVPQIIPFCEEIAISSGKLTKFSIKHGLSLGDRACIASGELYNFSIYTADKAWVNLQPHVTSNIVIIR